MTCWLEDETVVIKKNRAGLQRRKFGGGEILIRQGEPGERAWLIESGELEVLLSKPSGLKQVATVGPGAMVSEMALIDDGVRSATVRTVTDVVALELNREAFRCLIARSPPLAAYLLESLIAAIRRAYGLHQPERCEGSVDIRSTDCFQRIIERRVFREGQVFFRQDDPGSVAYLIQTGRVGIERDGVVLAELGAGRIFGELALLTTKPRAATAVALEMTVCEILNRDMIAQVISTMAPILRALTDLHRAVGAEPGQVGAMTALGSPAQPSPTQGSAFPTQS